MTFLNSLVISFAIDSWQASSHMALVRCFQLAFSIRTISLDQDGMSDLSLDTFDG